MAVQQHRKARRSRPRREGSKAMVLDPVWEHDFVGSCMMRDT